MLENNTHNAACSGVNKSQKRSPTRALRLLNMQNTLTILFLLVCVSVFADTDLPVAEKILIDKSERKMWLLSEGVRYREYDISLGDDPVGHKQQEGDKRTPEGSYIIDYRNPKSSYHLSLHITYPNEQDKARAKKKGVGPGGNIFIHGLQNGMDAIPWVFKDWDWTDGCIAVNNKEIKEIWDLVKNDTPIEILP